jgi:hypothetical protein
MAKRAVLLTMNQRDAELFVKALEGKFDDFTGGDFETVLAHTKVEWVVAVPTVPCTCAAQPQARRKARRSGVNRTSVDAFTKTEHFGWWVHAIRGCRKPYRMVIEKFTTNMTNGSYDLLPEILGDPNREPNDNRRWDEAWRSKR